MHTMKNTDDNKIKSEECQQLLKASNAKFEQINKVLDIGFSGMIYNDMTPETNQSDATPPKEEHDKNTSEMNQPKATSLQTKLKETIGTKLYSSLIKALGVSFLIFSIILITQKIGYQKYSSASPRSWEEIVKNIPLFCLISFFFFLTSLWLFFRYGSVDKYCLACRTITRGKPGTTTCPKCNNNTLEDLEGVFERHPELK